MFNLSDKNSSYIIVSPEKLENQKLENQQLCDKLCNILYSKDYTILSLSTYYEGKYEKSFMATNIDNNNIIRNDCLFLIDQFDQKSIIVKYKGEDSPKKIFNDGSESLLSLSIYESNTDNKVYLYNGISFAFLDQKRYRFLTDKNQLKDGMIVEFFNNNKWIEKKVEDVEVEYEKMYKLLIKYNKLRSCIG